MPLRLITGSANAGATGVLHASLRTCAAEGGRALLLLPSAPDVSRALTDLSDGIPVGVTVSTFDDHLDQCWKNFGDGRLIVTPTQRLALLAESGTSWVPTTSLASVSSPGVARALCTLVQRVAEAPLPVSTVPTMCGAGEDLIRCALAYGQTLTQAGFIERAAAHRLVIAKITPEGLPDAVVIDRFTGLTSAQEGFVQAASRHTDVLVSLVYVPGSPATLAAHDLVERLSSAGSVTHLGPRDDPGDAPELARLERSFGEVGPHDVVADGAVVLSEAWGSAAEAARIVREVQDALDAGSPAEQVAVVLRDVGANLHELRSAFIDAGIAAEFDVMLPFHMTGMGRAILMLLGLSGPGPTYAQLMDLLRTPFSPATDEKLDALDTHVRRTRDPDVRTAEKWLRANHAASAAFLAEARRACRDLVGTDAERRWYEITTAMFKRAYPGARRAEPDLVCDAAAVRVFIEAVRGVSGLGHTATAASTLVSALRETRVSLPSGDRGGHVQVMGAERIRGRRYESVIIGGLTSGVFPRRLEQDALSAPGIQKALSRAGIDASARVSLEAERLLFYIVATRASKRLVLSWQSHDGHGRPLRPSVFLDEVLDLYRDPSSGEFFSGGPPHRVLGLDGLAEHPAAPRSLRRTQRQLAVRGIDTQAERDTGLADARRRAHRARPSYSEGVRRAIEDKPAFSPSEIETYLQCRFRWYVQHLVRPREPDERLDRAAEGRLAHDMMRRFYDELSAQGEHTRVTPESLEDARAVHAEVCDATLGNLRTTTTAEAAMVRAVARRTLRLIEDDATLLPGMSPTYREWSFGLGEADPPEPLGGFLLAGRVDRIDTDGTHLVVTDYKLGGVGSGHGIANFSAEGLVQLPLYAAVASRRLGLEIAGGLYRSVAGGKPRGFVVEARGSSDFVRTDIVDRERILEAVDVAITLATEAVEGMRAGDIRAEPRSGACPSYCPARGFCGERRPTRG